MPAPRKSTDAKLLAALAAGDTQADAARKAGVSDRTVHRRLQDPAFKQQLEALRAELLDQALGRLSTGAVNAAGVLRRLLASENEKVQLHAAKSILALVLRVRQETTEADALRQLQADVAALKARGAR